jgi:pyrroline-5-carboxylate reductase
MNKKIAIIGGGNLGTAIAEGLIASKFIKPASVMVTKRNTATLQKLAEKGIKISDDNKQAVEFADYIFLAVKPFQLDEVLKTIKKELLAKKPVIISVATGVWIKDIQEILRPSIPIFRAMPNTAIAIQESMTCICSVNATEEQTNFVKNLFDQLGKTVLIEEKLMDAATVLAASGTAFALRFIRADIQAGIEIGFNASIATLIAAQTAKGAADLVLLRNTHPEQEIDKVTTPKGCTIAGLNEMEHQGFSSSLIKGITVSYKKILTDM